MILLEKYTTLDRVLELLKLQVVDSLDFASRTCPKTNNPEEIWRWLKPKLHFKDDAPGEEHLQSMQTLFKMGGRGDCDCFVITTLACLIVNNFDGIYIDLVGYDKKGARHIYTDLERNGRRIVLDFTNPHYNMERKRGPLGEYKYRQRIPVRWRNWF